MIRQRIVKNVLAMGVGQLGTWALSLVYFVLLGRYLGPDHFGELVLARSIVAVLYLFAALGMETLVTRAVARSPENTGNLTSTAIIARAALGIPMLAVLYVICHLSHLSGEVAAATYFFALAEILWSVQRVFLAAFQGRERMSLSAAWMVARNTLEILLALAVIAMHGGVVAFAAAEIPNAIVLLALTTRWMKGVAGLTYRVTPRDLQKMLTGGLGFWANEVFFTIYLYIDSVILAGLAGDLALGIYAPATKLFSVPMFLTGILGPATLPQLSRLGIHRGQDFKRAALKVMSLFIVCGVPATIFLVTFAQPLVVGIFGGSYGESAPVLAVLSLAIVPMFLNFQFSQILTASDRQWWWAAALAGSCVANPLLNFILIPLAVTHWHNGAVGAALAWLLTEILEVIYGVVILREVVFDRFLMRILLAAGAAGLLQCAAVWAIGTVWLPLAELVGIAVFAIAACAFGAVSRGDIDLLITTFRGRINRSRGGQAAPWDGRKDALDSNPGGLASPISNLDRVARELGEISRLWTSERVRDLVTQTEQSLEDLKQLSHSDPTQARAVTLMAGREPLPETGKPEAGEEITVHRVTGGQQA